MMRMCLAPGVAAGRQTAANFIPRTGRKLFRKPLRIPPSAVGAAYL